MEKDLITVTLEMLETTRKNMEIYQNIVLMLVISSIIAIAIVASSFSYVVYKMYDYEGYPDTDIINTNTNTNTNTEKGDD